MKMYMKGNKRSKESANPLPNTIAYAAIKNFLVSKEFEEARDEYCIAKLDKKQVIHIRFQANTLKKDPISFRYEVFLCSSS